MQMQISEFSLFPTRLLAIHFADAEAMNGQLYDLFDKGDRFRDGFDMHPDSLNLLSLAESHPAIGRLRDMLLEGLRQWLRIEGVKGPLSADMVLFSNFASRGDFTWTVMVVVLMPSDCITSACSPSPRRRGGWGVR